MPQGKNIPLRVSDIMVRDVVVAKRDELTKDIAKRMHERRIGSIVIVDDAGKPIGIVTERDLVYVCAKGLPVDTPAWAIMMEDPLTIKDSDLITQAMEKMREADVRHLPVVDEQGKLVGVISFRDVIDAASVLLSTF